MDRNTAMAAAGALVLTVAGGVSALAFTRADTPTPAEGYGVTIASTPATGDLTAAATEAELVPVVEYEEYGDEEYEEYEEYGDEEYEYEDEDDD